MPLNSYSDLMYGTCVLPTSSDTVIWFPVVTLSDFIYSTYNSLLEGGWRMAEIDQTDLLGFLRIRAWNAKREHEKKKPQPHHIDEVWPNLKP